MACECVVVPLLFEAARWAFWDPLRLLTLLLKKEKKKRCSVFPQDMDAINIAFVQPLFSLLLWQPVLWVCQCACGWVSGCTCIVLDLGTVT